MYTIYYDHYGTQASENIYGDSVEIWESGVLVVLQSRRVVRFYAPGVWQRCDFDKTAQQLTREQVVKEFSNVS